MKNKLSSRWKSNLAFSSQVGDHEVVTDAPATHGGDNSAPGPKRLMEVALVGCTGIDVISILKKMRVEVDECNIDVESELTEEMPSVYKSMHIVYRFKGKNLDPEKLKRAVELSQDKYCGVSLMYKKIMDITWEIRTS
jgi:putative redox protein